jgi:hypothetical protein
MDISLQRENLTGEYEYFYAFWMAASIALDDALCSIVADVGINILNNVFHAGRVQRLKISHNIIVNAMLCKKL